MRKSFVLFSILAAALAVSTVANADQWVNGYYRSNGTYVHGYHRSDADGNPYNNYSTYPNVNPYTGQQGTHHIPPDTGYGDSYSPNAYPNPYSSPNVYPYPSQQPGEDSEDDSGGGE